MINCENSQQAKTQAKIELRAVLRAAAVKGKFEPKQLDAVEKRMSEIVDSKFQAGANGSDMRSIVESYLPAVLAEVRNDETLQMSSSAGNDEASAKEEPFGARLEAFQSELAGLVAGRSGRRSFFDKFRKDPNRPQSLTDPRLTISGASRPSVGGASSISGQSGAGSGAGTSGSSQTEASGSSGQSSTSSSSQTSSTGMVAVSGLGVTKDEVSDYFNGTIEPESDEFSILLWLGEGRNPMLLLDELSYAKRLHNEIILPVARHYKRLIYGNANHPIRLGQIIYGIIPRETVSKVLLGGSPSRHLLGQAANFRIVGVDDQRVVQDVAAGVIKVDYGTIAQTSGVQVTLPFYAANGQTVRHMSLWTDGGVPGFVGYKFN